MAIERLTDIFPVMLGRVQHVKGRGEEATKQALVLPFLDALGYDVWNPTEVFPEFQADFAVKKAGQKEKVDLAVVLDGAPRIFIEVKAVDESLDGHQGQLARYFNGVPSVSLGVLTNGVEYRFYTDSENQNLLDVIPFYTFRLDSKDVSLEVLERFTRSSFSASTIRAYATELAQTTKLTALLCSMFEGEPSDEFVRWLLSLDGVYSGRVGSGVIAKFKPLVGSAMQNVLKEFVGRSIVAMNGTVRQPAKTPTAEPTVKSPVTTEEELKGFEILKGMLSNSEFASCDFSYKDTTVYFAVNIGQAWFARLMLGERRSSIILNIPAEEVGDLLPTNATQLSPSTFGDVRIALGSVQDLYGLHKIITAAARYTLSKS